MGATPFLTIRKSMRIAADRGQPDCPFHNGNHTDAPIKVQATTWSAHSSGIGSSTLRSSNAADARSPPVPSDPLRRGKPVDGWPLWEVQQEHVQVLVGPCSIAPANSAKFAESTRRDAWAADN